MALGKQRTDHFNLEKAVKLQLADLAPAFESGYGIGMIHPLGELPEVDVSRRANRDRPHVSKGETCNLSPVCSVWLFVRITGQLLFLGLTAELRV